MSIQGEMKSTNASAKELVVDLSRFDARANENNTPRQRSSGDDDKHGVTEEEEEEEEEKEYYDRIESMAARLYVAQLVNAEDSRAQAVREKHHDANALEDEFKRRAERAVGDIADALKPLEDVSSVPNVRDWLGVVSSVVLNSIAVKIPNPLLRYVSSLDSLDPTSSERMRRVLEPLIKRLAEEAEGSDDEGGSEEEEDDESDAAYGAGDESMTFEWENGFTFSSDLFPSSEGLALLGACSAINHSCEPNCEVAYIDSADVLIVATRDIDEDEEITIAYVPPSLPVDKRRQELRERYGFECECPKCERELSKRVRV